ncbi:MAG TPA: bifunctional phosphoribosylaminoimidazolecarboxamide formyltransferase/IMP cyclohydrolase [bacterium]|nr:bifunctional phosphoribosylaminoimidazolecarboxamide formyltransferase/IMP cyclohydrolase [bacterium]
MIRIQRALLSVSDKTGLIDFARFLAGRGVELCATGGTTAALRAAGLAVTPVEQLTGFPEILDGRVKTLHPAVFAGLLAVPDNPAHGEQLAQHGLQPFQLAVVNLYPFAQRLQEGRSDAELTEAIDIGGVAMLRAAAKNHAAVVTVSDPGQYPVVRRELAEHGSVRKATARALAAAAFSVTARLDALVYRHLAEETGECLDLTRRLDLRYGENPAQEAVLLGPDAGLPFRHRQGKELSYNNLLDLDTVIGFLRECTGPAAVVTKHAIPCGAKEGGSVAELYRGALAGDPTAAYGGVLGFTVPVDLATAKLVTERFWEIIVAPSFSDAVLAQLAGKPKLTVLEMDAARFVPAEWEYRSVAAGVLKQQRDRVTGLGGRTVATRRQPTEQEWRDLEFAYRAVKWVRSNAIVVVKTGELYGTGAGQMSRIAACRLAVDGARAEQRDLRGAVMASDGFFPFPDCIEYAAAAGITAVVQPGGSVKDAESIAAADRLGLALVLTGERHFRH